MRTHLLVLAWFLAALAGCQAVEPDLPAPPPVATAQPVHILLTSEVRPVEAALFACSESHPELTLRLTVVTEAQGDLATGDLFIHLGYAPNPNFFHAPLAQERFTLASHRDFPVGALHFDDLQAAFRGELRSWDFLAETTDAPSARPTFWTYPEEHPLLIEVFRTVVEVPENLPSTLFLAPDPEAMRQALQETPGALGFLPASWFERGLNSITMIGEPRSFPTLPVIATAVETPMGAARVFLACLQGPIGQEALSAHYQPWTGP